MLKTLPQIMQLNRLLPAVPPNNLPRLPEVFLVVCEHDEVLERVHGASGREVDVGGHTAEFRRAIWSVERGGHRWIVAAYMLDSHT